MGVTGRTPENRIWSCRAPCTPPFLQVSCERPSLTVILTSATSLSLFTWLLFMVLGAHGQTSFCPCAPLALCPGLEPHLALSTTPLLAPLAFAKLLYDLNRVAQSCCQPTGVSGNMDSKAKRVCSHHVGDFWEPRLCCGQWSPKGLGEALWEPGCEACLANVHSPGAGL